MKKKSFKATGLVLLAAVVAVLALCPVTVSADLFPDSVFCGPVTLNGDSIPAGSLVTGWIDGVNAGPWSIAVYVLGRSEYSLHIPLDSGTGPRNGGVQGDIVKIKVKIGNIEYQGTPGIFQKATNVWLPQVLKTQVIVNPNITTDSLPNGTVGVNGYSTTLAASGGTAPYTWSATGLPGGLTLSAAGVLSGKPQPVAGDYGKFTVPNYTGLYNPVFTVTDSASNSSNKSLALNIVWKKGDANGDGVVSVADVTKVELIILGMAAATPGGDANLDGAVTIADVTKVELMILGLSP